MMEVIDIVNKLIGPIEPVGETHVDDGRYENLQQMLKLMQALHMQIDEIAHENKGRQEYSMSRAGKLADAYLDWLGIEE